MKNAFKISCLIIATIIGAGFSTGREIFTFFNIYKDSIFIIVLTAFIVFYLTIYFVLKLSYNNRIATYKDMINVIFENKYTTQITIVFNLFLLIISSIMIAGFGEFINSIFGIHQIYGSIFLLIICFFTLLNNIDGIMKISAVVVPLIIIGIFLLFCIEINSKNIIIDYNINISNYLSGIIYASYNLVIAIPVIVSSSRYIKNIREIKYASLISSIVIIGLILIIYFILDNYCYEIKNLPIPLLYIAKKNNKIIYYIYQIVIAVSIYTTAVSTQYSVIQKYKNNKYIIAILCTGLISLLISFLSFNSLINICFPVIGIIGLWQTFYIIKYINCYNK